VIATDAPLTAEQLKRLARRASVGLGRLGAIESDGSGDIFIAFSTANAGADEGNWDTAANKVAQVERLRSEALNPLFEATVQGVEESVINALVAARTMTGADYWTVAARPPRSVAGRTAPPRHASGTRRAARRTPKIGSGDVSNLATVRGIPQVHRVCTDPRSATPKHQNFPPRRLLHQRIANPLATSLWKW